MQQNGQSCKIWVPANYFLHHSYLFGSFYLKTYIRHYECKYFFLFALFVFIFLSVVCLSELVNLTLIYVFSLNLPLAVTL